MKKRDEFATMLSGEDFAIMLLGGPIRNNGEADLKIIKTFSSLEAARAYHFAMHGIERIA